MELLKSSRQSTKTSSTPSFRIVRTVLPLSLTAWLPPTSDLYIMAILMCAGLRVTTANSVARPASHAIVLDEADVSRSVSITPSSCSDLQGNQSAKSLGTPTTVVSPSSEVPCELCVADEAAGSHGSLLARLVSGSGSERNLGRTLVSPRYLPPPAMLFWALRCLGKLLWLLMWLLSVMYTYAMMPLSIGILPYQRS